MNKLKLLSLAALMAIPFLTGCEKVANSAKNLQSDWMGLERQIEVFSCLSGNLMKTYIGDVRINEEDQSINGTSLLIDGKKINFSQHVCYIIEEVGIKQKNNDAELGLK